MSSPPDRPTARATVAVRVGLVLFVIGLGFIIAAVIPFFDGDTNRSLWVNLGCLLAPLGFVIALWAGLRRGRQEQRAALRDIRGTAGR